MLEHKERLLKKIDQFMALFSFSAVVPLSAKTGDGVEILLKEIEPFCVAGPHMFDADTLSDQPSGPLLLS
jgi:GTP-binding protein Era